MRLLPILILLHATASASAGQVPERTTAELVRTLRAEADALAPPPGPRAPPGPDARLLTRVRNTTDPAVDAFAMVDSIGTRELRLAALAHLAVARPDLAEPALDRAKAEAAGGEIGTASGILSNALGVLMHLRRTADVIAIVSGVRPLDVRAGMLFDMLGSDGRPDREPARRALRAAADSMQAEEQRLGVLMRLAWLDDDSTTAVTATRALLAELRPTAIPAIDAGLLFRTIASELGFRHGGLSPLVLLRELELGAPPQVTLDVARRVAQRWLGPGSDRATANDTLMRGVLDVAWRAANALPEGLAGRSRADLLEAVALSSAAAALERVDAIPDPAGRDRVRLSATQGRLYVNDEEGAATIAAEIVTPAALDEWRSSLARHLATQGETEAALDTATRIVDDTLRAALVGIVGAAMHARNPDGTGVDLVRQALTMLRLGAAPPVGFPAPQEARRHAAHAAARILPEAEPVTWARAHENPVRRAEALRLVAFELEQRADASPFIGTVSTPPATPLSDDQRGRLHETTDAAFETLTGPTRDSLRTAVVAVHLLLDAPDLAQVLATAGLPDSDELTTMVEGAPEHALRTVLEMPVDDSVRDAAYAGIALDRAITGGDDPLAVVDSIASPPRRIAILLRIAQSTGDRTLRRRAIEAAKRVATDEPINLGPARLNVHDPSLLLELGDALTLRDRAILTAGTLDSPWSDAGPGAGVRHTTDRVYALADSVDGVFAHALRAVAHSVRAPADSVQAALRALEDGAPAAEGATRADVGGVATIAVQRLAWRAEREAALDAARRLQSWLPDSLGRQVWHAALLRNHDGTEGDVPYLDAAWRATGPLADTLRDDVRLAALHNLSWASPRLALDRLHGIAGARARDRIRQIIAVQHRDSEPALADSVAASFETDRARDQDRRTRAGELVAAGRLDDALLVADSMRTETGRGSALGDMAFALLDRGDREAAGDLLGRALDALHVGEAMDPEDEDAEHILARQEPVVQALQAGLADVLIDWAIARPEPRQRIGALAYIAFLATFTLRF